MPILGSKCGSGEATPQSVPMLSEVLLQMQARVSLMNGDGGQDAGVPFGPIKSAFVLQFDRFRLRPVLASEYPAESLPFSAGTLVASCFPNGQWTGGTIKEEPVNTVITDSDGSRHYIVGILVGQVIQTLRLHGLAAHTYQQGEHIAQAQAWGYVAQACSGSHVDVVVQRGSFSTTSGSAVIASTQVELGTPVIIEPLPGTSLPVCCGLVLDIPMINTGPEWVRKVFRRIQGADRSQVPTAEMMWAALHASCEVQKLQEAGALLITHMFTRLGINQPGLAALPAPLVFSLCSDVPIRPLFECFSLDVVFEILGLLLSEHRVVLVAKEKHRQLPWVMEAIRSLAGPFMRISPHILGYHCPDYLVRVPAPFFVGWNALEDGKTHRRKNSLRPEDEVWQYNVDTGRRDRPHGRIPVELPREFRQRVAKSYKDLHRTAVNYAPVRRSSFDLEGFAVTFIDQGNAHSVASSFTAGCASDMEYGKYIEVQGVQPSADADSIGPWLDLKHGIVALFFVEFVRIFRGYDVFLKDLQQMPPQADGFVQSSRALQRGWRGSQSCAFFLKNFLVTSNWDQYMLQLDQAQGWLRDFDAGQRTLWPQNTCLLVALFHELCCRCCGGESGHASKCCLL